MTQTLQERRSVAAEQVDAMLATLSEKKVQKITELFDKTVIQENLDDTNLTEEWEAYHDWLAIRTGSPFSQLSEPGNGKHKIVPNQDTVSEDSKVDADLEEESKSSNEEDSATAEVAETTETPEVAEVAETTETPEVAETVDTVDDSVSNHEQVIEEVKEPVESTEDAEPESFFSADDHVDLEDEVRPSDEESESEPDSTRIGVNDVLQKEFTIDKLRGGYKENDVDDFLDAIAAFLNEEHTNAELDENIVAIQSVNFQRKKLGSGCNIKEVDDYLDALVEELKARKN